MQNALGNGTRLENRSGFSSRKASCTQTGGKKTRKPGVKSNTLLRSESKSMIIGRDEIKYYKNVIIIRLRRKTNEFTRVVYSDDKAYLIFI